MIAVSHNSTRGLGWSKVSGYKRVPEPPTVAKTWGNMAAGWCLQILSLSLAPWAESLGPDDWLDLVAAHDLHNDAGDHESEDEQDDVEGNAHYVHESMLVISGL